VLPLNSVTEVCVKLVTVVVCGLVVVNVSVVVWGVVLVSVEGRLLVLAVVDEVSEAVRVSEVLLTVALLVCVSVWVLVVVVGTMLTARHIRELEERV
jgi:hypothetical protein